MTFKKVQESKEIGTEVVNGQEVAILQPEVHREVKNKKTGEDLNLCAYDGFNFNPVITINNNHNDCKIIRNLNV